MLWCKFHLKPFCYSWKISPLKISNSHKFLKKMLWFIHHHILAGNILNGRATRGKVLKFLVCILTRQVMQIKCKFSQKLYLANFSSLKSRKVQNSIMHSFTSNYCLHNVIFISYDYSNVICVLCLFYKYKLFWSSFSIKYL